MSSSRGTPKTLEITGVGKTICCSRLEFSLLGCHQMRQGCYNVSRTDTQQVEYRSESMELGVQGLTECRRILFCERTSGWTTC